MNTEQKKWFADWLRFKIKLKGDTFSTFSKRVGLETPTVLAWVNGKSTPKVEAVLKLARGLEIPVTEILERIENPRPVTLKTLLVESDEVETSPEISGD